MSKALTKPSHDNLERDYARRSRTASRKELDTAGYKQDPWYKWHVLHVIGLVLSDHQVEIALSKTSLQVLAQSPYAGTYEEAKGFIQGSNLKRYILENGVTYDVLVQHYGRAVANEVTTWARQLTRGEPKKLGR